MLTSSQKGRFLLLFALFTGAFVTSNAADLPLKQVVRKADRNSKAFPLGACEGHCEYDSDCKEGLSCAIREPDEALIGCSGNDLKGTDYCYDPPPGVLVKRGNEGKPRSAYPLGACEGECRNDSDCAAGLSCFKRNSYEHVPGCTGRNGIKGINYCHRPPSNKALEYKGKCTPSSPCSKCQGDCANNNNKCKNGLICISRTKKQHIPGCVGGGRGDLSGIHYCSKPPPGKPVSYVPGNAFVVENGLLLSKGLTARIIATAGEKVRLYNGGKSRAEFHGKPDGAAVFADKETGGWIYVSNSEKKDVGGVGAITFDANGNIKSYKMLLSGTNRNCGGTRTYWNTWLSCEEIEHGQVWEVDPKGRYPPRKTIIGGEGAKYEAAAFDNRNTRQPKFFVTVDEEDGPMLRYSPDEQAVSDALKDPLKYRHLLHTNRTGTAKVEYLVLKPKLSNPAEGSFYWTENKEKGRRSAFRHYQNGEGINVQNGTLYFVSMMKPNFLFILDIDKMTYKRERPESGSFTGSPDQLARTFGDDDGILYFCESAGKANYNSGIHGRDAKGRYFTILENAGSDVDLVGETTGLAFSPDNKHMYLSYQHLGRIYDITRKDNYSFVDQTVQIKYHAPDNLFRLH